MYTFESYIMTQLQARGLWDYQAREIMTTLKADDIMKDMAQRWQDSPDGYPPALLVGVWMNAERHALRWIDENMPEAWFRPLFVKEA